MAQRELILGKLRRDEALLALLDKTILATKGGIGMGKEEMFEVFGEFDPSAYEDDARERWGDSEAYRESARRTGRYSKQDWEHIRDEGAANLAAMVELFDAGVMPDDPRAMDIAEEARLQIDRAFYPCSHEMHVTLGQMYVTDPRFTACYDTHRGGLARWFAAAIKANAARGASVTSTA